MWNWFRDRAGLADENRRLRAIAANARDLVDLLNRVIASSSAEAEAADRLIRKQDELLKAKDAYIATLKAVHEQVITQARLKLTEALGFPVEIDDTGVQAWVEGLGMTDIVDVLAGRDTRR